MLFWLIIRGHNINDQQEWWPDHRRAVHFKRGRRNLHMANAWQMLEMPVLLLGHTHEPGIFACPMNREKYHS